MKKKKFDQADLHTIKDIKIILLKATNGGNLILLDDVKKF